jgi:phage gp29-like protein
MMAPWPQVDRYPIRLGSRVTFDYIGAAQRIALTGYRQQWVDLLQELRNRDPSAFANLEARIFATAGGRVHVVSASAAFKADDIGQAQRARVEAIRQAAGLAPSLPELTEDERLLADQIATHVQRQIDALPRKPQVMAQQLWAIYYGVAGNELLWERRTNEWALRELHYVHPRRWAYPDQNNWHPHVWDQGFISPTEIDGKTTQPFGVDVCDYPGKFLVHVPEILSGYPTEDGLGFVIAWWIAAKIMGARSFMQYIEKYSKPGTVARYNTKNDTGQPRNATPEDIDLAVQVVQQMGFGGLPGVAIPDSIELDLFGPGAKGSKGGTADPQTFATWCDDQIARAIRTTDGLQGLQKNGARAAMETLLKGADRVAFYDAIGLAATWTRDTSCPITRLNYPTFERLAPTIVIHVESEPGPDVILERAAKAVAIGMPLDADKVAAKTGMTDMLADRNDPNVRVLYPVKALEILPPANQSPAPEVGEPKKPEPTDEEDQEV